MGKLEATLRSEITRLARKELRPVIGPLAAQVRALSREVRALRSETQRLTRATRKLESERAAKVARLTVPERELATSRMSAGLIKKLRGRHGITQQQLAQLVGVSAAAVQSWEQGIARPTGENRVALVALRKLGAADIVKLMEQKGIAKAKRRPRTRVRAATAPSRTQAAKRKVTRMAKKKAARKKVAKKKVAKKKAARKAPKRKAAKKKKVARKAPKRKVAKKKAAKKAPKRKVAKKKAAKKAPKRKAAKKKTKAKRRK